MREPQVADTEPTYRAHSRRRRQQGCGAESAETQLAVLERLPVGVLIHRNDALLYANRAFLEWTGYADVAAVAAAGGLERLVVDPQAGSLDRVNGTGKTFTIATRSGDTLTCEGLLYSVPWKGESALMLALIRTAAAERHARHRNHAARGRSRDRANCAPSSTPRPTASWWSIATG